MLLLLLLIVVVGHLLLLLIQLVLFLSEVGRVSSYCHILNSEVLNAGVSLIAKLAEKAVDLVDNLRTIILGTERFLLILFSRWSELTCVKIQVCFG